MRNLIGMIFVCSVFMMFGQANATVLPPVNTNIVNVNKAQFIGSMVTSNNDSSASKSIRQAVTPLNPQFKDCTACNQWLSDIAANTAGIAAKFVGSTSANNMQTSWGNTGYVGYIGSCTNILTGSSCLVPE